MRPTKESGVRRSARRAGAVAVIAAGALLLSGCGSGDDGGGKGGKDNKEDAGGGEPQASASASASDSGGTPDKPSGEDSEDASGDGGSGGAGGSGGSDGSGGSGKSGKLAGVWKAKGKQVVLTVVGDSVTLLREEGKNCTGSLGGTGGRTVALKCPGGADDTRTNGTVGALKSKSMTVSWKGGPTEAYARVSDVPVKLPES